MEQNSKDAEECVWTGDEDDVINSVRANRKKLARKGATHGNSHVKKKGKSAKWNRSQVETIDCAWDFHSDAVSDLTECLILVQKPRAKKELKWGRDPKSAHECDWDIEREIKKTLGVLVSDKKG